MPSIILYHFPPSGPSRAGLLAARQLDLEVDIRTVNLMKKEQLNPEFIKVNPQHTVPTLVDGDFTLWDSHAIAPYLVNVYGKDKQSLYPSDPKEKALVDQRLYFDSGTLYARIRAICFPVLYLGETTVSDEKKKSLEEAFNWVDIFLKNQPWIAGPNLTLADTAFLASITGILEAGYDLSKHPLIVNWLERCKSEIKGYKENEEGAKIFGNAVSSKLQPGQL